MNDKEKQIFQEWLQKNTDFTAKVIADTISRLNRIQKIRSLTVETEPEDFIFQLSKNSTFGNLKPSVKSQLKRAYNLYHQSKKIS